MARMSAGILLYKRDGDGIAVLIVHPGGPFWQKRDAGAWSIPKGEYGAGEDPLAAAKREFAEELSLPLPGEPWLLGSVVQAGGKRVTAYALEGDADVAAVRSNSIEIEWPPRSGRRLSIPEIDRAAWLPVAAAREKLLQGQRPLLDMLEDRLRQADGD